MENSNIKLDIERYLINRSESITDYKRLNIKNEYEKFIAEQLKSIDTYYAELDGERILIKDKDTVNLLLDPMDEENYEVLRSNYYIVDFEKHILIPTLRKRSIREEPISLDDIKRYNGNFPNSYKVSIKGKGEIIINGCEFDLGDNEDGYIKYIYVDRDYNYGYQKGKCFGYELHLPKNFINYI